jgi:hypothetical protein
MRLSLSTRAWAIFLAIATGAAAPAAALAHGVDHARIHRDDHRGSTAHHHSSENSIHGLPILEDASEADHPHYDLVSTTCGKTVLRWSAVLQPRAACFEWVATCGSQRSSAPEHPSWIDPPLTRNSQPRAPPRR